MLHKLKELFQIQGLNVKWSWDQYSQKIEVPATFELEISLAQDIADTGWFVVQMYR